MKFSNIFNVFSKRNIPVETFTYQVPITLRNKVLLLCRDTFTDSRTSWGGQDLWSAFIGEMHRTLLYRHGSFQLIKCDESISPGEDLLKFLLACKDEEFLDFIEYIFRADCFFHAATQENVLVAEINTFFATENVVYELTEMVKESVVEPVNGYPFHGRPAIVEKKLAYPQVIRKENLAIHATITGPVLQLLANPKYKTANQEYLEALEDYKKGDYGDCLTKSCSAFESTMKIICAEKGWAYNQTDTASTLIKIILKNSSLDSYFETPLTIIATLRNKLSKSHGAGIQPKVVTENLARYALNSSASAIILLVNETR